MQVGDAAMVEARDGWRIVESLGFEDMVTVNGLKLVVGKRLVRKAEVNALALPVHSTFLSEGVVRIVLKGLQH
jgi:hypothetical protein